MTNDLNFGTVSGTIATFVRDPIDRFYSAVAEIYAAGLDNPADHDRWNPDPNAPQTWVKEMVDSIKRKGFLWNDHIIPQNIFLRHNNGTKLAMEFVGSMKSYNRDLKALYGKAGAIHAQTIKVVHGPEQTKFAEILRGKKAFIRAVSEDDLLFLCKMYYEDYIAFDLIPPNNCRSLFSNTITTTKAPEEPGVGTGISVQAAIAPIAVVDAITTAAGSGASTSQTATIAAIAVAAMIVLGAVAVVAKVGMSARSAQAKVPAIGHIDAINLIWEDEI